MRWAALSSSLRSVASHAAGPGPAACRIFRTPCALARGLGLSHAGVAWRLAVFGAVGCGFWFLFTQALAPLNGTLVAFSGPVWSDWSLHATLAQSYLLGHNLPPLDPFKAGSPLHYPFLVDFQPALLGALGQNLWGALDIPSFAVAFAAAVLVWHAAWRVLGGRELTATLALTLVLFGGSLGFIGIVPRSLQQLSTRRTRRARATATSSPPPPPSPRSRSQAIYPTNSSTSPGTTTASRLPAC